MKALSIALLSCLLLGLAGTVPLAAIDHAGMRNALFQAALQDDGFQQPLELIYIEPNRPLGFQAEKLLTALTDPQRTGTRIAAGGVSVGATTEVVERMLALLDEEPVTGMVLLSDEPVAPALLNTADARGLTVTTVPFDDGMLRAWGERPALRELQAEILERANDVQAFLVFNELFPNARFALPPAMPGESSYLQGSTLIFDRYVFAVGIHMAYDAEAQVVRTIGTPEFILREIERVSRRDGRIEADFANEWQLDEAGWKQIVNGGGDLRALDLPLIEDEPVRYVHRYWDR